MTNRPTDTTDQLDAAPAAANGREPICSIGLEDIFPAAEPTEGTATAHPNAFCDTILAECADGALGGEGFMMILEIGWAPMECERVFRAHADRGLAGALLDLIDFVRAEIEHYEREHLDPDSLPAEMFKPARAALAVAQRAIESPNDEDLRYALGVLVDSPTTRIGNIAALTCGVVEVAGRRPIVPGLLDHSIRCSIRDLIRELAQWHDDVDAATNRERAEAVAKRFRAAMGASR